MSDSRDTRNPDKQARFDGLTTSGRLIWALYVLCALLLLADLAVSRDGPLAVERWFGIYPLIGLVAAAAVLPLGAWLGRILGRPEDYYDR
jgi:hypothetical protein